MRPVHERARGGGELGVELEPALLAYVERGRQIALQVGAGQRFGGAAGLFHAPAKGIDQRMCDRLAGCDRPLAGGDCQKRPVAVLMPGRAGRQAQDHGCRVQIRRVDAQRPAIEVQVQRRRRHGQQAAFGELGIAGAAQAELPIPCTVPGDRLIAGVAHAPLLHGCRSRRPGGHCDLQRAQAGTAIRNGIRQQRGLERGGARWCAHAERWGIGPGQCGAISAHGGRVVALRVGERGDRAERDIPLERMVGAEAEQPSVRRDAAGQQPVPEVKRFVGMAGV
jgi:hypothetical protein